MRYLIVILVLLLAANMLYAKKQGQAKIDSLLAELEKAEDDTSKVKLYNFISWEFQFFNI